MAGFSFGNVGFTGSLSTAMGGVYEPTYANAYALRRKSPGGVAYVGPCMRLFNPTTNMGQDIGFAGNVYDTVSHNAASTNGFTKITTWYDQSGNLRHATQPNPSQMPNATLAYLNGQPALRLEIGLFLAYTSPSTGAAPRSLLVAYANQATNAPFSSSAAGQHNNSTAYNNTTSSLFLIQSRNFNGNYGGDGHPFFVGYGTDITDFTTPNKLPLLATAAYDGATVYLRRNRVQIGASTIALVSIASGTLNGPDNSVVSPRSHVVLGEVLATASYAPAIVNQLESDLSIRFAL